MNFFERTYTLGAETHLEKAFSIAFKCTTLYTNKTFTNKMINDEKQMFGLTVEIEDR